MYKFVQYTLDYNKEPILFNAACIVAVTPDINDPENKTSIYLAGDNEPFVISGSYEEVYNKLICHH